MAVATLSPRTLPSQACCRENLATKLVILGGVALLLLSVISGTMWSSMSRRLASQLGFGLGMVVTTAVGQNLSSTANGTVDFGWYAPSQTQINNLTAVADGKGVYGFIYNTSDTLDDRYGTYNWCNMPHVRRREYVTVGEEYELIYVELIHRHHKRTPYASNAFPVEPQPWDCDDQVMFHYSTPVPINGTRPWDANSTAMPVYWRLLSILNPFADGKPGLQGNCQFPQITSGGLADSLQHGADLYEVYHDLHGLLPGRDNASWRNRVVYRVTNNMITSQVVGMVLGGTWGAKAADLGLGVAVEPEDIDSLEPKYPCPIASSLFSKIQSSSNEAWKKHLDALKPLFETLDEASGVSPADATFHKDVDHYYDNLSAKLCHQRPLPCRPVDKSKFMKCVSQDDADAVFRFGHWEYDQIYRSAGPDTLNASSASFGVWVRQLGMNLRDATDPEKSMGTVYRHHVAHDGSVSRLLSILQADVMVWPGMGSEVVFELYRVRDGVNRTGDGGFYVRVLFGGKVLRSSNPSLGVMWLVPLDVLLGYFDGLTGTDPDSVVKKCNGI
ncbi:counting factor 60 [Echria macrotheca]|uniref:Counting factor 60 n=1 Tax=Echria macrotheca TaxID=438768 RepID=A0AAJ0BEE4_9PEZI|nr:counting factor 60 [Echria macrotheca]